MLTPPSFPPHHHHSFCVEDGGCKAHRWNRSQQVCAQLSSAFCADHTIISRTVREEVAQRIAALKAKSPRFHAELAIIQAGTRPDSSVYVRMKQKAAEEVGITFKHITLPAAATVEEVVEVVKELNIDPTVNGILVQLPLGPHVTSDGERTVTEAVSPEKDVDG